MDESRGAPSPLAISVLGKLATPFLPSDDKEGASVGTLKIFLTTSVKIPWKLPRGGGAASHRQHALHLFISVLTNCSVFTAYLWAHLHGLPSISEQIMRLSIKPHWGLPELTAMNTEQRIRGLGGYCARSLAFYLPPCSFSGLSRKLPPSSFSFSLVSFTSVSLWMGTIFPVVSSALCYFSHRNYLPALSHEMLEVSFHCAKPLRKALKHCP